MIPPPDAVWSTDALHLGRQVHVYDRLDSTNTLALTLGHDPAHDGLVLLAREQTAGRGQYGRTWQAPPGSSVLMTALLFPPPRLCRPALLTAWAAVSVCVTVRQLVQVEPKIKWPNDVLILGKKVCGILIEQRTTGHADFPLAAAVGIGLNLTQSATMFADAGLPDAGSLFSLSGLSLRHENAAKEIIRQLDAHYHLLLEDQSHAVEAQWRAGLDLVGKPVALEGANQWHHGQLLELTLTDVAIEVAPGEVLHLPPESVRHIHNAG